MKVKIKKRKPAKVTRTVDGQLVMLIGKDAAATPRDFAKTVNFAVSYGKESQRKMTFSQFKLATIAFYASFFYILATTKPF